MSDQTTTPADEPQAPMTAHGFPYGAPPTPKLALMAARDIIKDEKRWCTSSLFEPIKTPEYEEWEETKFHDEGKFKPRPTKYLPTTCTNVKVCAVGALVLVCYDGPLLAAFFGAESGLPEAVVRAAQKIHHRDFDEGELLTKHPVGGPAMLYLGAAAKKSRGDIPATKDGLFGAVSRVEQLNDHEDSEEHLNKVIELFDRAVELADQDEKAGKTITVVDTRDSDMEDGD